MASGQNLSVSWRQRPQKPSDSPMVPAGTLGTGRGSGVFRFFLRAGGRVKDIQDGARGTVMPLRDRNAMGRRAQGPSFPKSVLWFQVCGSATCLPRMPAMPSSSRSCPVQALVCHGFPMGYKGAGCFADKYHAGVSCERPPDGTKSSSRELFSTQLWKVPVFRFLDNGVLIGIMGRA